MTFLSSFRGSGAMSARQAPQNGRLTLWLALLVMGSVGFTLSFACAVPLAAFGAVAAVTLARRTALYLMILVWLANQIVGYGVLHYPLDGMTFAWGLILGAVALLSTIVPQFMARYLRNLPSLLSVALVFASAFVAYEGSLFLISVTFMGGAEDFVPSIVLRIAEINASAFAGLLALNVLARAVGVPVTLPRLLPFAQRA